MLTSGRGAAWIARRLWVPEVASSNLAAPTWILSPWEIIPGAFLIEEVQMGRRTKEIRIER